MTCYAVCDVRFRTCLTRRQLVPLLCQESPEIADLRFGSNGTSSCKTTAGLVVLSDGSFSPAGTANNFGNIWQAVNRLVTPTFPKIDLSAIVVQRQGLDSCCMDGDSRRFSMSLVEALGVLSEPNVWHERRKQLSFPIIAMKPCLNLPTTRPKAASQRFDNDSGCCSS